MKIVWRFCYLLLISLSFSPFLMAQQARFDTATELLEENEFRQAVENYQQILNEGYESGALWFNMGIAYTRLDSLGMAKYYFMKAAQFSETEQDANQAISFVNERFNRRSAVLPALPWDRFFEMLSKKIGTNTLHYFGFGLLYTGVLILLYTWLFYRQTKLFNYLSTSSFLLSVIIFFCAFYVDYLDNRYSTGVLVDREISVYENPQIDASIVSSAYEGYTMRVDHNRSTETEEWYYIRLENGMYGWVQRNSLMLI